MKIAAVIVTFNRLDLLKQVIASIRRQTVEPNAVVVVDNGSTDGTQEWLDREPGLTVIRQENVGGAGGFHTGIKYAYEHAFDWIWCMDDDVSPRPDCLQHLLENDRDSVGILCPRRIQNGKTIYTEIVEFNLANPFSRIGKIRLKNLSVGDKAAEIKGMSFEGPLIKKEVVAKIGYPEKELFLFYDDVDYSYRAVSEGYKVLYVPGAVLDKAYFDDGLSRVEQVVRNKWRLKYHLRNTTYFCKKHGKNRFFRYCGSIPLYLHMFGAICYNLPRNEKYTPGDIKMLFEMYSNGIKGRLGKKQVNAGMKRKIIHIYWQLTLGGIETMLVNLANAQADAGADVTVLIVNDLYDETLLDSFSADVNVMLLHKKPYSGNPSFIFRLNRVVRRVRPDAIHLHSSKLYGLIFGRRLKCRCCCTLHNVPMGRVQDNGWLHRLCPLLAFRQSGNVQYIHEIPRVFAISGVVRRMLLEAYGTDSTVVANGIRTGDFTLRPSLPPKDKLRIVQVSRLEHEHKGQDLLIEAAACLEGCVEVDFVGEGASSDYLRRLAETMGVERCVHFLGNRTQRWIGEHLCTYDLFIQPSRYEGFGLTVAEAMAARLPVLVSAGQGTAEITCGDQYGWLFANGDAEDLARMIRYIQGHYDEALLKAERACTYVKETYDVSVTAQRYLEAYETQH